MIKRVRTLFLFFCVTIGCIYADNGDSWDNYKVVSTEGNDFWVTLMLNSGVQPNDVTLQLQLIGAARQKTDVTVEYLSTRRTENFQIPENKSQNYLINDANAVYCTQTGTIKGKSIHVFSKDPQNKFSLYASNEGSSSFDASIIIPTQALRKSYIIQTCDSDRQSTEFAVIAVEDYTILYITPSQDFDTIGHKNIPFQVRLNKGDVFFARSKPTTKDQATDKYIYTDLSGTTICANKKIGVLQGGQSYYYPALEGDDHVFEQSIPSINWGKSFSITKTLVQENNRIRITAEDDNTQIYRNNTYLTTINHLQTYEINLHKDDQSTYITTSKPTLVFLYMESAFRGKTGDPSMVRYHLMNRDLIVSSSEHSHPRQKIALTIISILPVLRSSQTLC